MLNAQTTRWFILPVYLIGFCFLNYSVERHETAVLFAVYICLFTIYLWILKNAGHDQVSFWICASIILRVALLFSLPNLSEDFYRFIWDGRLTAAGFHPFSHPPSYYIQNNVAASGIDVSLYAKLNSKEYYSVYPPVAQLIFLLCASLSTTVAGSLLWLKTVIVLFDTGVILIMRKLLVKLRMPEYNVLIYALNPLVIIELAGNAHYESVMILFLMLAIFFLRSQKISVAALSFGLSVSTKLLPLMFLPSLWPLLGKRSSVFFYMITAGVCVILFLPFLNHFAVDGLTNSLGYFFSRFEFNASVYYIVREVGLVLAGFNIIHIAGPALAAIATILIMWISLKSGIKRPGSFRDDTTEDDLIQWLKTAMWCMTIYLLFTTIVHPWYTTTLVAISIFTTYRFVVVWTFMIFFTYTGYSLEGFDESLTIVVLEYVVVAGYLLYELKFRNVPAVRSQH